MTSEEVPIHVTHHSSPVTRHPSLLLTPGESIGRHCPIFPGTQPCLDPIVDVEGRCKTSKQMVRAKCEYKFKAI